MSKRTNLCNIIQNPNERVAILKPGCHASFSINSYKKITYFRSTWNSCHLNVIVSVIVRVVWTGFCSGTEVFDPEESALCSEALDKDTLIQSRWVYLSIRQRKKSVHVE